jgi:signal transduction histidine kinase
MVTAAFFIGTTFRARRAYLEALVERARQLEVERDQEARLAVTRERTRIARELHDIVTHSLSVMIALADGAALTIDRDPASAADAMHQVSVTGRGSMTEMRRLLGVLRDDDEATGLAPAPGLDQVPELAARLLGVGPRIDVQVTGEPSALPPTEDATAYRIIQESLTNVMKHAVDATLVQLSLDWQPGRLCIEVVDDGRAGHGAGHGAGRGAGRGGKGHGLVGMSERVSMFAGQFAAGPVTTGGWRVQAVLPIGIS